MRARRFRRPGRDARSRGGAGEESAAIAVRSAAAGSAANLNVHPCGLVLDGVYRCGADGKPAFVEVRAPTDDEMHALMQAIIAWPMALLTRRGATAPRLW
jgi:hypothetical protein